MSIERFPDVRYTRQNHRYDRIYLCCNDGETLNAENGPQKCDILLYILQKMVRRKLCLFYIFCIRMEKDHIFLHVSAMMYVLPTCSTYISSPFFRTSGPLYPSQKS